jgi:hypothetical protein
MRHNQTHAYDYGTITLYGAAFQRTSSSHAFSYWPHLRQKVNDHSHNPAPATPAGYHTETV